jgi:hypothetical protein
VPSEHRAAAGAGEEIARIVAQIRQFGGLRIAGPFGVPLFAYRLALSWALGSSVAVPFKGAAI